MIQQKCLLCNNAAVTTAEGPTNARIGVECPTCGKYGCSDKVYQLADLKPGDKNKLQAVIRERSTKGLPPVFMVMGEMTRPDAVTIESLLSEYPKTATEMIDRTMLNLGRCAEHPCDEINFGNPDYPIFFARERQDMAHMATLLESMDYVTDLRVTGVGVQLAISAQGWKKIEELQQGNLESKRAFVAMWFAQEMWPFWEGGFQPGIEQAGGFTAIRGDLQEHNDDICDRIVGEIRRSRFVVADFTGNRGGVYYEAGFAQGLGIPVIWTVREDWLGKIHFDTRQYNHIHYETSEELRNALKNRIMATIPDAAGKPRENTRA